MDGGEQVMFGKPFYRLVSGSVIVEDETRAIVHGRQIRSTIVAGLAGLIVAIITTVVPSANLPRLFASLDMNLEQSTVWH
ncbi:hypothetical protein G7Y89_g10211 [Cudoniella acicularis]|uniref:Uncharacterized protein n=1 Tax=Cudoniella acicularis TaxID=354080 RepID=A0A8H4VZ99_9HELO|nr:hypothetical protein G7Y89_g10211 [Cudoniella acicularis]